MSAEALKAALGPAPRARGTLTVEDARAALGRERVRLHDPAQVETMNLNGARVHIYAGPHPLLDAAAEPPPVGHADFDVAPADRGSRGDPCDIVPLRRLALLAADTLKVPAVDVKIRDVARIQVEEQVAGVRVLVEFLPV